ncbi:hypothetical protein B9Z55_016673 [Caenorhabditis nigoni]|uniref:F-box domain-containing protein n=1 Tax=Caenorhabditis nigoni TaxID=1611254 RepID=A0A2G5T6L5_9PELO|nr:hypothetical protein B9Z55_016673 [Caenorhabditis nigoni]
MPVNLLKLPCLIREMIVTELSDHQEVFLLSLCSRRTKFLVVKARIKLPNVSFQFQKCRGYNQLNIGFELHPTNHELGVYKKVWYPVTSVLHRETLELKEVFTVKLGNDYEADTKFVSWCEEDGKLLHRMECANEPMGIQKALQEYINSIFHYSGTNKLYLLMKCEENLPNISNNFNGRNMRCYSVVLPEQDIIQFIQKWISNEAYHNLETLSFFKERGIINAALVRQAIVFEEYNRHEPEKRPVRYDVVTPIMPMVRRYFLRNEEWFEVKRITDGKRAFVKFFHGLCHFFVHKDPLYASNDDDYVVIKDFGTFTSLR